MTPLADSKCEACRADAPRVSDAELPALLSEIPDWTPVVIDNVMRLERSYSFPNFVAAIEFTNRVAELAEAEDHHPALLTEWGKVTVTWWTHKIKGLHRNDFIMAAQSDRVYLEVTST